MAMKQRSCATSCTVNLVLFLSDESSLRRSSTIFSDALCCFFSVAVDLFLVYFGVHYGHSSVFISQEDCDRVVFHKRHDGFHFLFGDLTGWWFSRF